MTRARAAQGGHVHLDEQTRRRAFRIIDRPGAGTGPAGPRSRRWRAVHGCHEEGDARARLLTALVSSTLTPSGSSPVASCERPAPDGWRPEARACRGPVSGGRGAGTPAPESGALGSPGRTLGPDERRRVQGPAGPSGGRPPSGQPGSGRPCPATSRRGPVTLPAGRRAARSAPRPRHDRAGTRSRRRSRHAPRRRAPPW